MVPSGLAWDLWDLVPNLWDLGPNLWVLGPNLWVLGPWARERDQALGPGPGQGLGTRDQGQARDRDRGRSQGKGSTIPNQPISLGEPDCHFGLIGLAAGFPSTNNLNFHFVLRRE